MDPTALTAEFREFLKSLDDHDLPANKAAAKRNKDLADLDNLP
jgi:hypothetical protein